MKSPSARTARAKKDYVLTFIFADGTTLKHNFTYEGMPPEPEIVPTITKMYPTSGAENETHEVTITGTELDKVTKVLLGSSTITSSIKYKEANTLVLILPARSKKDYVITLIFENGKQLTQNFAYEEVPLDPSRIPSITEMTPTSGTANEECEVTVTGNALDRVTKIILGSSTVKDIILKESDTLKFTLPARSKKDYVITFIFDDGSTLKQNFSYTAS